MTQPKFRLAVVVRLLALALSIGAFAATATAQQPKAGATGAPVDAAQTPAAVIDLNQATEADLMSLPGVGPSKAKAIVSLRARMKGFKRVEDLMRVKGIGRKTFRKLRPMVRVGSKQRGAK